MRIPEVSDGSNSTNPETLKVKLSYKPVNVECNLHYRPEDDTYNTTNPDMLNVTNTANKL
jgi:hypothetical protein